MCVTCFLLCFFFSWEVCEGGAVASPALLWSTRNRKNQHHPRRGQTDLLAQGVQLHGAGGKRGTRALSALGSTLTVNRWPQTLGLSLIRNI